MKSNGSIIKFTENDKLSYIESTIIGGIRDITAMFRLD